MSDVPSASSQYQHIDDGLVAYCKQPVGTTVSSLLGDPAIALIEGSARLSGRKALLRSVAYIAAALLSLISLALGAEPMPAIIAMLPSLCGALLGGMAWRASRQREEPREAMLAVGASPSQLRNLRAMEEFRNRLADGQFAPRQRLPNGTHHALTPECCKSFIADHGRLLIISRDQSLWSKIRNRPIPVSEIWVSLGGRVGKLFMTSRTLIDTADETLFERQLHWLSQQASGQGADARSFRKCLNLIVALRRADLRTRTFDEKKEILATEGYSYSLMEKIHSGNYESFQRFLHNLPLHEFP